MKRQTALMLILCLLLGVCAPAQASEERFSSMAELAGWLFYDCAYMLADEVEFSYTQALDDQISSSFPWKLLRGCGIFYADVSVDRTHRRVTLRNIDYYPGFKAAQAWEIEVVHLLDADERTMLARAEAIVEEAQRYAQSPYQVLVNLHDALTERVVFTSGENISDSWVLEDTALGALVYGKAECDGYADALYLLGTLAGFQVRMLSGYAGDEADSDRGAHMWNLVWMEDGWYHLDAAWDDLDWEENSSVTSYRYFLMGSSMMSTHEWDENQTVVTPAKYTNWDLCYYTADSTGVAYGAYYNTLEDAASYAAWMQRNHSRHTLNIMVDGDYKGQSDRIKQALRDAGMKGSRKWWTRSRGDYSFITIYME